MSDLQLVEPDDAAYAELSSKFADYNTAHATWDWSNDLLVLVKDGTIVAGGHGILNIVALDAREFAVDVGCSEGTDLTELASSGPP